MPIQYLKRKKAREILTQLSLHEDITLKSVAIALQESLSTVLSSQEAEFISMIENRRSFLLRSDKKIHVIDYGAGSPHFKRGKREMEQGLQSTESVSEIVASSKPKFWGLLLFKLIRELKPLSCVELGTCVGISASYQAAALKINGIGQIVSLEGAPEIAEIARDTFNSLEFKNASVVIGPFHQTFKRVLEASEPVDFLFNDGHHDYYAVRKYFDEAIPYLSDGGVIVFDDISWSPGMRKAWKEIEELGEVSASIDLQSMGIVVVKKNFSTKQKFEIPL
ncbi:MAG: putative S-adenosylmethionine-dependent methyltransferase [Anaerophaga sp.]|nr:putative S-adenosylmethionine-dependent methyltransferase [Anaerophaga sp.]